MTNSILNSLPSITPAPQSNPAPAPQSNPAPAPQPNPAPAPQPNPAPTFDPLQPYTVTPVPDVNLSDDQWLTKLMQDNGIQPAPAPQANPAPSAQPNPAPSAQPNPAPSAQPNPAPSALPDFIDPNATFVNLPSSQGQLPNADPSGITTPPSDNSELTKIKELLTTLQTQHTQTEEQKVIDDKINAEISKLQQKYGTTDPKLIDEFKDVFSTFRAEMGKEFGSDFMRENVALKYQLENLKQQVNELINSSNSSPQVAPVAQPISTPVNNVDVYRNTVVQRIPNYQQIVNSPYFQQLLTTPVDADNPNYTFNNKLGNMFNMQKTVDIEMFFNDVANKLGIADNRPNSNVVVDGGITPSTNTVTNNSLTPETVQEIFGKIMTGELTVSEEELTRFRQMVAKQSMK